MHTNPTGVHGATVGRLGILASMLLALFCVRARAADDYDRWFVVLLDGQRCGWSHEWQVTEGETVTSFSAMSMTIRRGQARVSIEIESEFVETTRGEPIRGRSVQAMGAQPVVREFTWTDEGVVVETTQSGRTTRETVELPEGEAWLTPAAAAEFVRARLVAGAEEIEYRSMETTEGVVFSTTTIDRIEPGEASLLDGTVEATAARVVSTSAPGIQTRTWIDTDGRAVRSEIPMGGMTMTMVMTDQATAMERGEAPELMVQTLVKPSREIEQPRRVREASYVLRISGEGWMPDIPATSNQTAEILGSDTVRVVVDMRSPARAEADAGDFLGSSSMLDIEDPELVGLTRRSLRTVGEDPRERAEALRRAVYRHIRNKTLGVGFATASEVCRTREGDCSEHGVLLAALLRADGIPSRVVSGLIYVDEFLGEEGVFGFHMWTQALVEVNGEPRWVDLDATLPPGMPFDATHIALVVSGMADGNSTSDMTGIASMLGTLSIEVERTEP